VAGAVAAARLLDAPLPSEALFTAALEAEAVVAGRHPDNVAPSLLGGAVVVLGLEPLRLARLVIHPSLRLVFVLPGYGVETAGARAALPPEVSRADAVGQAAALAGLVLGLERGDGALIRSCLVDRIAEPVRLPLYPGYPEARSAAIEAGALGVAVSGAGPTLLALALAKDAAGAGAAAVEAYRRVGIEAQTHVTSADAEGARVVA
jgi:homoserine kinase